MPSFSKRIVQMWTIKIGLQISGDYPARAHFEGRHGQDPKHITPGFPSHTRSNPPVREEMGRYGNTKRGPWQSRAG